MRLKSIEKGIQTAPQTVPTPVKPLSSTPITLDALVYTPHQSDHSLGPTETPVEDTTATPAEDATATSVEDATSLTPLSKSPYSASTI